MNTAQPIRSEQELKDFMNFYEQVQYHPRNQLLLTMGLNTALRISDLLSLQWKQVYDLENRSVREHLLLVEAKTGKASNIYLNEKITVQLQKYYQFLASERSFEISGDAFLWKRRRSNLKGAGLPNHPQGGRKQRSKRCDKPSFLTENIWILCVEAGSPTGTSHGDLSSFLF